MKAPVLALAVISMIAAPLNGAPKAFSPPGYPAPTTTVTWTNAGGGYCLQVLTLNGRTVPVGQIYCPHQSTSFVSPDGGASVYIGDDILEAQYNQVVRGVPVVTKYNADGTWLNYTTTDTFSVYGDTVTATQNFVRTYSVRCGRTGCHKYYYDTNIGGSGTILDH